MRKPIGRTLVEGGLVSDADVERALAVQRSTNRQLGEILVSLGVLDWRHLQVVLGIQDDLADPERALGLAAGIRLQLGEILVETGRTDRLQLAAALDEQARTGEKLGEIAVRRGWLDSEQLDRALRFQAFQARERQARGRLSLGEILVATGDITRAQLDAALASQRVSGKLLGNELLDAGYLKPSQLADGLWLQRALVGLAMAAALFGGTLASSQPAGAADGASARVSVSASVLRHVSIRVISAPSMVDISAADIARGYADVSAPARLEVRSNDATGYALIVESLAEFAVGAEVRGFGDTASLGHVGGVLNLRSVGPGMTTTPLELKFRILLAESARPGTYEWPYRLSVLPN